MIVLDCIDNDRKLTAVNEKLGGDLIREIEKRVYDNPNLSILDIGCGKRGNAIEEIAKEYPSVKAVGIDPKCKPRLGNPPNLQIMVGEVFELPFQGEFDIVYSTFVFLFIEGFKSMNYGQHMVAKAVINVAEALRPEGVALLHETNYSAKGKLDQLLTQIKLYSPDFLDKLGVRTTGGRENEYLRIERLL